MRITSLGVNSAFATGTYKDVIELDEIEKSLENYTSDTIKYTSANPEVDFSSIDSKKIISSLNVKKAYFPKWQSNFLIEFDKPNKRGKEGEPYRFVLDFGGDLRHSLLGAGLNLNQIDALYCSHLHSDHGQLEPIAFSTFFNPYYTKDKAKLFSSLNKTVIEYVMEEGNLPNNCKPDLYAHPSVLKELWKAASPGLDSLQGVTKVELETYFDTHEMVDNIPLTIKDGNRNWQVWTIISVHVVKGHGFLPSYGLMFEDMSGGPKVYIPTDSILMSPPALETFYKKAHIVYQDCETGFRSGVHPYIDDLKKLDKKYREKMLLYHYNDEPIVKEGEFLGVLKTGDIREF